MICGGPIACVRAQFAAFVSSYLAQPDRRRQFRPEDGGVFWEIKVSRRHTNVTICRFLWLRLIQGTYLLFNFPVDPSRSYHGSFTMNHWAITAIVYYKITESCDFYRGNSFPVRIGKTHMRKIRTCRYDCFPKGRLPPLAQISFQMSISDRGELYNLSS